MDKKSSSLNYKNIGKYIGGGALAGGGLAALLTYLRDTKRQLSETSEDTSLDDDVLYIKGKRKPTKQANWDNFKPSEFESVPDSGSQKLMSVLGLIGGGVAGYSGIKSLYNKVKERQLQDELDSAQVAYMSQLTSRRDKERNKYASTTSTLSAGVMGSLLALALASGVISYNTLNKYFPARSKEKQIGGKKLSLMPEKIKVLGRRNKVVQEVDTDGEPDDADKMEGLIRSTIADSGVRKQAGFDDLICAIADGRTSEIKSNLQYGINHTFDMIKGASRRDLTPAEENLAVGVLARDPMLKEAFGPLFASEYAHMSPGIYDAAVSLSDEDKIVLEKLAAEYNFEYRRNNFSEQEPLFEKGASALMSGFNILNNVESKIDEGTSFMSSGEDSNEDEDESDEETNRETDQDLVDGFFDKGMGERKQ